MIFPASFRAFALSSSPALACIAAMAIALPAFDSASAASAYKKLYAFCTKSNCADGGVPGGGMIQDSSGVLYGTTQFGGAYDNGICDDGDLFGCGTVFEMVPNSDKSKWTYKVIRNFCSRTNCTDGAAPGGDPVMDTNGNLYVTVATGGAYGAGAIEELTNVGGHWNWKTIHSFNTNLSPYGLTYPGQHSGKLWNANSDPAFGVTQLGGTYGNGAAYEIQYNGSKWIETTIHNFESGEFANELVEDDKGNLWGTTYEGTGSSDAYGLLYELTNKGGTWSEKTLYDFCSYGECYDGGYPIGRLLLDSSGNLYGTTSAGGLNCSVLDDCGGTVFEYTTGGGYNILYNFCSLRNCKDGNSPSAGLIFDNSNNLVGTTFSGGSAYEGVGFELVNHGGGTWAESVLASLGTGTSSGNGYCGTPLTLDSQNGNLYGTSGTEYSNDTGVVFEIVH